MHSDDKNHPRKTFPANQDQFPHRKSSLPAIFIKSGCIPLPKIISARRNLQTRITSPPKCIPGRQQIISQQLFSNRQLLINQQFFSHQAFSFPGLIRSNAQKLCDRRCNILYAYILWLFPGLEIFSPTLKFFPLMMNGMVISSGESVPCVLSWPP